MLKRYLAEIETIAFEPFYSVEWKAEKQKLKKIFVFTNMRARE